jgi:hypothetical protein
MERVNFAHLRNAFSLPLFRRPGPAFNQQWQRGVNERSDCPGGRRTTKAKSPVFSGPFFGCAGLQLDFPAQQFQGVAEVWVPFEAAIVIGWR